MGLFKKKYNGDNLSQAMQDEAIKISSERLGYSLSKELIASALVRGTRIKALKIITNFNRGFIKLKENNCIQII